MKYLFNNSSKYLYYIFEEEDESKEIILNTPIKVKLPNEGEVIKPLIISLSKLYTLFPKFYTAPSLQENLSSIRLENFIIADDSWKISKILDDKAIEQKLLAFYDYLISFAIEICQCEKFLVEDLVNLIFKLKDNVRCFDYDEFDVPSFFEDDFLKYISLKNLIIDVQKSYNNRKFLEQLFWMGNFPGYNINAYHWLDIDNKKLISDQFDFIFE